eukprot:178580_1
MQSLANCVEQKHISHDRFQSYMCWMLLFGAMVATIPPAIVVIQTAVEGGLDGGCIGEEFVVYAHYSTHQWLIQKFNDFQALNTLDEDVHVCYELKIEDSALTADAKPSVWIPETYHWIDVAEQKYGQLIQDRDTDCTKLTNVPFGIITWKKLARVLSPDASAVSFDTLIQLATQGWVQFTNGEVRDAYPTGVDTLHFAHGHPNVTSGGVFGLSMLMLSGANHNDTETDHSEENINTIFDSERQCQFMDEEHDLFEISVLAKHTIFTTPIDYALPHVMMSRGPEYVQMVFGWENDVAEFNRLYKDELIYLWNDTLAMLYLEDSVFIEHPICKLTASPWYSGHKSIVATQFVEWLTETCETCISDLELHGLRPYNKSIDRNTSVISDSNGCNLDIVPDTTSVAIEPDAPTAQCIQQKFTELKKHTRVTLLLDVSGSMHDPVDDHTTRWAAINDALPLLLDRLENDATFTLQCFYELLVPGPGCSATPYPNGTLEHSRAQLKLYFEDGIQPRDGEPHVHLFDALLETYIAVNATRAAEPKYRYVILIISEPDTSAHEGSTPDHTKLLNSIPISQDPLGIAIFAVLYYGGKEDSTSFETMNLLATRTNGQFATANAEELNEVLTQYAYYW